jgi:hypothetical protein
VTEPSSLTPSDPHTGQPGDAPVAALAPADAAPRQVEAAGPAPSDAFRPTGSRTEQASVVAFLSGCLGMAILAFVASMLLAGGLALLVGRVRDILFLLEPPNRSSAALPTMLAFIVFVATGALGLLVGGGLMSARRTSAGAGLAIGAVIGAALMLAIWLAVYLTAPA